MVVVTEEENRLQLTYFWFCIDNTGIRILTNTVRMNILRTEEQNIINLVFREVDDGTQDIKSNTGVFPTL